MKLAALALTLALVIAAPAATIAAESLTWTLAQPPDGPLSLDGGSLRYHAATPVALTKSAAAHASARVVYGKAYFRFTARYRTTGPLAPTVLIHRAPEIDRRPLTLLRLPPAPEWTTFTADVLGHDPTNPTLELRLAPGTTEPLRMQEGGLEPAAGATGTAEFASVTWERLARPVEELPRGSIAFTSRTVVFKTVGALELKLQLDEPARRTFPRAALVWFHGGGFVGGNPDSCRLQTSYFASRGLFCIRPQYRLVAQGGNVDATLADVADALAWLRANAADLNLDPTRLILAGTSAGAVVGAVAAVDGRDCLGFIGLAGYYDALEPGDSAFDRRAPFFGNGDPALWRRISARHRIVRPVPTLLIHGALDSTLDARQSERFAAALIAAGAPAETLLIPELNHVPNLAPPAAFARIDAFIARLLERE